MSQVRTLHGVLYYLTKCRIGRRSTVDFNTIFAPLDTEIHMGYRSLVVMDTIYKTMSKDKKIHVKINECKYFWKPTMDAHRRNIFMSLGSIFDTDDKSCSIHYLKRWLKENNSELLENKLMSRKNILNKDWEEYKKGIFTFDNTSFLDIANISAKLQKEYIKSYKMWRDKIFAHRNRDLSSLPPKLEKTFNEIESMFFNVYGVYMDGWEAFYNGRKFSLLPFPISDRKKVEEDTIKIIKTIGSA
jgi:hypothetical protein